VTSVGWLGVVIAKIAVGFAAINAPQADVATTLFTFTAVLNPIFPPAAIATIVTGIFLSLGTRWGLFDHYWVVLKLILTVAVIVTAVRIGDRFVEAALGVPTGALGDDSTVQDVIWTAGAALSLSIAHALMLIVAAVLSVFKPWGRTFFAQRSVSRQPSRAS